MQNIVKEIRYILESNKVPFEDRGMATELLAADAVGNCLSVPSAPVKDPVAHFRLQLREDALNKLSLINEQQVIDLDRTLDLAYKLWLTRYRLVHEAGSLMTQKLMAKMVSCGGFDIPPQVSDVACRYPNLYANRWLMDEVKDKEENRDN